MRRCGLQCRDRKLGIHWRSISLVCIVSSAVAWINLPAENVSAENPHLPSASIRVENALLKTIESIQIAAEVPGLLAVVPVSEGSLVKPGSELARIRDESVRLQVERAKVQVESVRRKQKNDIDLRLAMKTAAVAENEFKRAENANRLVSNTYPQNEIDRLRLVADRANLEIERAKLEQELLSLSVILAENDYRQSIDLQSRHRVLAPMSGMVVLVEKHAGEWVEPGTTLVQLVRIDRLRIEGFVTAVEATQMLVGAAAKVAVTIGQESVPVEGKVVFVSPDANPVNGQVRVFLEIENPQGALRPGLKVQATIAAARS